MQSSFGKKVQVAFWIMLFSFNLYLSFIVLGWSDGIYRSVINVFCHLINFYSFYSLLIPRYYEKRKLWHTAFGAVAVLLLLTPARLYIETEFAMQENLALRFGFAGRLGFVLFTEIAVAAFASLLRLAQDNEKNKQQIETLSRVTTESELRFLKAQMNPHFLFNTINNIYSLTLLKSDKAPEALMKLSGLLRYLLYESNNKVPLAKEMEALNHYAELFQLKHEHPLNVTIVSNISKDIKIEPLVLVPILENALKHSGVGLNSESYAMMEVTCEGNLFTVNCRNSKDGGNRNDGPGGIGLSNIRKRLDMAYGPKHDLQLRDLTDHYELSLQINIA